jgi:hypothetical protein
MDAASRGGVSPSCIEINYNHLTENMPENEQVKRTVKMPRLGHWLAVPVALLCIFSLGSTPDSSAVAQDREARRDGDRERRGEFGERDRDGARERNDRDSDRPRGDRDYGNRERRDGEHRDREHRDGEHADHDHSDHEHGDHNHGDHDGFRPSPPVWEGVPSRDELLSMIHRLQLQIEQLRRELNEIREQPSGDRPRWDVPREKRPAFGPREGDRPRFAPPRESDRPRFEGPPRDGDRPAFAPRDGDRPRFAPRREGDRPRFDGVPREGDRPGSAPRDGEVRRPSEGFRPNFNPERRFDGDSREDRRLETEENDEKEEVIRVRASLSDEDSNER